MPRAAKTEPRKVISSRRRDRTLRISRLTAVKSIMATAPSLVVASLLTARKPHLMIQLVPLPARNTFMQPQNPSPPPAGGKGLPAVLPPSGAHIVKLFIVPLLIVGGLLLAAYAFLLITGGSVLRTPDSYLADLRSGNPDVRWRAAQDLAQVLPRNKPAANELASNPTFGLELAVELGRALDELSDAEKTVEKKQKDDPEANLAAERKDLEARRNFTLFLSSCVGSLRHAGRSRAAETHGARRGRRAG